MYSRDAISVAFINIRRDCFHFQNRSIHFIPYFCTVAAMLMPEKVLLHAFACVQYACFVFDIILEKYACMYNMYLMHGFVRKLELQTNRPISSILLLTEICFGVNNLRKRISCFIRRNKAYSSVCYIWYLFSLLRTVGVCCYFFQP